MLKKWGSGKKNGFLIKKLVFLGFLKKNPVNATHVMLPHLVISFCNCLPLFNFYYFGIGYVQRLKKRHLAHFQLRKTQINMITVIGSTKTIQRILVNIEAYNVIQSFFSRLNNVLVNDVSKKTLYPDVSLLFFWFGKGHCLFILIENDVHFTILKLFLVFAMY